MRQRAAQVAIAARGVRWMAQSVACTSSASDTIDSSAGNETKVIFSCVTNTWR